MASTSSDYAKIEPQGTIEYDADVIVVGAGLAGLACADKLSSYCSVLILEARSRVGGRTCTTVSDEHGAVDLGGMWWGPTQTRLLLLSDSLGVARHEQYDQGKRILDDATNDTTAVKEYTGTIPNISVLGLLELQISIVWHLDSLSTQVPLDDPWICPHATEWDTLSVKRWVDENLWTQDAKNTVNLAVSMIFGVECRELSLLYFLYYVHSAGGLMQLIECRNCAQHGRFVGGAQQLADKLAARVESASSSPSLRHNRVICHSAVRAIQQTESGVVLTVEQLAARSSSSSAASPSVSDSSSSGPPLLSSLRLYRCRYVVLAIPPTLSVRIQYDPPLPFVRDQMAQRLFMGCYTKCIVFYERAFWREAGFSGEALRVCPTEHLPVLAVYDYTKHDGSHPALVAFITGDIAVHMGHRAETDVQKAVINSLCRFFGQQAGAVLSFQMKAWSEDEWSRGCPVNCFPPGSFARFSNVLREPCGRLHWAGTETATSWTGYMEGALQSGGRAADEVHTRLLHPEHQNENQSQQDHTNASSYTAIATLRNRHHHHQSCPSSSAPSGLLKLSVATKIGADRSRHSIAYSERDGGWINLNSVAVDDTSTHAQAKHKLEPSAWSQFKRAVVWICVFLLLLTLLPTVRTPDDWLQRIGVGTTLAKDAI